VYFVSVISIRQPLAPCAAVMLPPPPVHRISPYAMDSIRAQNKKNLRFVPVLRKRADKVMFSDKEIERFDKLTVKWNSDSISIKELILELRGGDLAEWVAKFGIAMAIIMVLNNVDAFQVPPGANVSPHREWLYGTQKPGNHFGYGKGAGPRSITVTGATKNASKFRESIRIALIWAIVTMSPLSGEAKSIGFPGAESFTPPAHSRPANKNSGFFNQPKPQNQNPGSDKPGGNASGGDDNNSDPEPEFIEYSKPADPYDYRYESMYQSDTETTDTETESDWFEDSDWEENFLKNLSLIASDGNKVYLNKEQLRDKSHHLEVFPPIQIPKTFDLDYVKTLDYKSRLEYGRDRNNLPEKTIFDMQMEASKFFRSTKTKAFSGSLGRNKIEGTVYINKRTRTLAFVNKSDRKCRTLIKMSDKQLQRLKDRNYHLFPKV